MNRPTSAQAYAVEKSSGRIDTKQAQVLRAIRAYGEGTSAEILRAAGMDANRNLMRARFTELADSGKIVESGTKKCAVTGRTAITWRAVASVETVPPRQKSARNAMRAIRQIAEFRAWARSEILRLNLAWGEIGGSAILSQIQKLETALGFFSTENDQ